MSKFNCPYCDYRHDYHECEMWEHGSGETSFECQSCGEEFIVNIEYEPVVEAWCPEDKHTLVEYWEKNKYNSEDDIRSKHPNLANSLWCSKCRHFENKPEQP